MVVPILPGIGGWLQRSRSSMGLKVREEAGQLLITWTPAAAMRGARLEIFDGVEHTTVLVLSNLANATYTPRTGDVEVRLIPLEDRAQLRRETVHYVGHGPAGAVAQAPVQVASKPAAKPAAAQRHARRRARVQRPPDPLVEQNVPQVEHKAPPVDQKASKSAYFWR